jgi:hypothetical protein
MATLPRLTATLALCCAVTCIASHPRAQADMLKPAGSPWAVPKKIPEGKEISGIACAPLSSDLMRCIIATDEGFSGVLVTLQNRSIQVDDEISLVPSQGKEFDAEGAAFDAKTNAFYVIGSHGKSRHKCEDNPAAFSLIRIPIDPKTGRPSFEVKAGAVAKEIVFAKSIKPAMLASEKIGPHVDKCLGTKPSKKKKGDFAHEQGANVEGLAILGGNLFVGFRGPVQNGTAYMLKFDRDAVFAQEGAKASTIEVKLGNGMGVRDLAAVAGGLLVLSGPEDDDPGKAAIHYYDDGKGTVDSLGQIPDPADGGKPEALLLLEETPTRYRVLVLSDSAKNGEPTEFLIDKKK